MARNRHVQTIVFWNRKIMNDTVSPRDALRNCTSGNCGYVRVEGIDSKRANKSAIFQILENSFL
jgi:hypothetical protein